MALNSLVRALELAKIRHWISKRAPSKLMVRRARRFEIRFRSLFREGRGLAFPCDATGHVDLDALSERGRCNYLFARRMVGREFATPSVSAV
jgi:hypothetical protein